MTEDTDWYCRRLIWLSDPYRLIKLTENLSEVGRGIHIIGEENISPIRVYLHTSILVSMGKMRKSLDGIEVRRGSLIAFVGLDYGSAPVYFLNTSL